MAILKPKERPKRVGLCLWDDEGQLLCYLGPNEGPPGPESYERRDLAWRTVDPVSPLDLLHCELRYDFSDYTPT